MVHDPHFMVGHILDLYPGQLVEPALGIASAEEDGLLKLTVELLVPLHIKDHPVLQTVEVFVQ
ncbi:hypothetical protein D3C86_1698310 [compost metagenome]